MKRILPAGVFRAFVSQRVSAERDAEGRVWCPLFPLGTWHRGDFPGGKLELTPDLFAEFIAAWTDEGSPALPVDYEHVEDEIASGWIEGLRIAPTGLEGAIRWTDAAASEIKADQRRYISPTWAMAHVNRRTGEKAGPWLYGAALTNSPFFDSMPRVAATAAPTTKESTMEFKKRIAAAFGLPEDTSDEDIATKCEAMCKSHASAGEDAGKLTASLTASTESNAKLQARVVELETLTAKHAEDEAQHKAELFERDFTAAFDAELANGRQGLPDLKDTLKATAEKQGLDVAKKLMAALPTVKLAATGTSGDDKPGTDLAKFEAAIEVKVKAGMKWTDASKAVFAEMPELAAKLFTNSTRA